MNSFNSIIDIGFDKNGEADYRMAVAALGRLSFEQMKELRALIPVAIGQVEQYWRENGPIAHQMAQCVAAAPQPHKGKTE